jgi:hypothetical protein
MNVLSMDASITGGGLGINPNLSSSSCPLSDTTGRSVISDVQRMNDYDTRRNLDSAYFLRNDGVM